MSKLEKILKKEFENKQIIFHQLYSGFDSLDLQKFQAIKKQNLNGMIICHMGFWIEEELYSEKLGKYTYDLFGDFINFKIEFEMMDKNISLETITLSDFENKLVKILNIEEID